MTESANLQLDLGGHTLRVTGDAPIAVLGDPTSRAEITVNNGTITSDGTPLYNQHATVILDDVELVNTGVDATFGDLDITDSLMTRSPVTGSFVGGTVTNTEFDGAGVGVSWAQDLELIDSEIHGAWNGVYVNEGRLLMSGGTLHHNIIGATGAFNPGGPILDGVEVHSNGVGALAKGGNGASIDVRDSNVHDNGVGIRSLASRLVATGNSIHDNRAAGIDVTIGGYPSSVTVTGNTLDNNGHEHDSDSWQFLESEPGVALDPAVPGDDGFTIALTGNEDGALTIEDNIVTNNADHGIEVVEHNSIDPQSFGAQITSSGNTGSGNGATPQCDGDITC